MSTNHRYGHDNWAKFYFDAPRGVLPKAGDLGECILRFGKHSADDILKHGSGTFLNRCAVDNPGVQQDIYFEENGYEYHRWAIYDEKTNTIRTNEGGCPFTYSHHIGNTCKCCGQVD